MGTPCPFALVESIRSRSAGFPTAYGDAETFTTSPAPSLASSAIGSRA